MLAAPTKEEVGQLNKAIAIMTPAEKEAADKLTDEQIKKIADDAKIDSGVLAIFLNGYAIGCKKCKPVLRHAKCISRKFNIND